MQPPEYIRIKDFTENFGSETDHSALNGELDKASNSINDIRTNLAILQADDGKLRPKVVTPDSISPELRADLVGGVILDTQQLLLDAQAAGAEATAGANTATAKAAEATAAATTATNKAAEATASATTAGNAAAVASARRDEADAARDTTVAARDIAVGASNTSVSARDEAIASANTATTKRNEAVTARDIAITKRDEAVVARDTAVAKANEATNKAEEAAASAAQINIPAIAGNGHSFIRVMADETGYEHRTASQVLSDIGAVGTSGDQTIAGKKTFSDAITAVNAAKAWVNVNGTGTVAVRSAHNVTSIADVGVGHYQVNFAIALPAANYVVTCAFDSDADAVNEFSVVAATRSAYIPEASKTTAAFSVRTGANGNPSSAPLDFRAINLAVFL